MRQRSFKHSIVGVAILTILSALTFVFASCGTEQGSTFNEGVVDSSVEDSNDPNISTFPTTDAKYCKNLQCQQIDCAPGKKTTVTGVVYDPAGKVPLYNVVVYVPNSALSPLVEGATCDKCGSNLSGEPLVTALTNTKGEFTLENVPVGQNIPLVIQLGKWRREFVIPTVAACENTLTADKDIRLPRNQSEGNIPKIALTTGNADALECLLRKVGIDDAEFTSESGNGRVHLYQGFGGGSIAGITSAQPFWSSVDTLKKYDMVLLSCEGAEHPENKPAEALQALQDYTSVGGRVFSSHFHYYWFEHGPQPFPTVATWNHQPYPPSPYAALIDQSFPKGKAFAEWMMNVGGSTAIGQLSINEARNDVSVVNGLTTQRWIYGNSPTSIQYMTFNTPVGVAEDNQCGRIVFSDLHVGSGDQPSKPFPTGCVTSDLTPQQKALEFMLFDLSSCIQKDTELPTPPAIK